MMDMQEMGAVLYPTMAQPMPVETKPTSQTASVQTTADTATTPLTAQPPVTEQHPDASAALTLPEDAVIEVGAIERTLAFAQAAGLSPEAAQQVLEHANGEVAAYQEHVTQDWTKLTRETWVNETKTDPEIGGEKFQGAVTDAKRFLDKFGDEELRQFLDDTGFGNNRLVIRLLARAEKGVLHKRPASGAAVTATPRSEGQKTYPYMNP